MITVNGARLFLILLSSVALSSCGFSKLKDDLERYEEQAHDFDGSLALERLEADALVVIAMQDRDGNDIYSFRVMSGPGDFQFKAQKKPLYFFAFDDQNKDFVFQPDEPFARNTPAGPVDPNVGRTNDIRIVISGDSVSAADYPRGLVGVTINDWDAEMGMDFVVGDQTALDNALFSEEQAKKGLWQPYQFMVDGGAGIHFLEDYDADRIPVLFVHGVNVTTLFDTPLPENLPYQLLFGFKQTSILGSASSDGVIKLTSQLRNAAQEQAFAIRGYDESHVSILSSNPVITKVYAILNVNSN